MIVTATDAVGFARAAHEWILGDWVISYAVGFVRRGLIGELLRHVGILSGVSIGSLGASSQIVSFGVMLSGLFWLGRKLQPEPSLLLFLVSPATLLFPLYSFDGGYRKEVLFLALLVAVGVHVTRQAVTGHGTAACLLIAAVAPVVVLAHEGLYLYF